MTQVIKKTILDTKVIDKAAIIIISKLVNFLIITFFFGVTLI